LLVKVDPYNPKVDRGSAKVLHDRLREFQNEYKNQQWGPVRIIHNWDLMLLEQALAIRHEIERVHLVDKLVLQPLSSAAMGCAR